MPCSFDPMQYCGQPIGMFHCPECDEMVLACVSHPTPLDDNDPIFDLDPCKNLSITQCEEFYETQTLRMAQEGEE